MTLIGNLTNLSLPTIGSVGISFPPRERKINAVIDRAISVSPKHHATLFTSTPSLPSSYFRFTSYEYV